MTQEQKTPLYPGTRVRLSLCEATVYPVSFKMMKRFGQGIMIAMRSIGNMKLSQGSTPAQIQEAISKYLGPVILEHLLDLVAACTTFDDKDIVVDDLPHWDIAPLIEAFVNESFMGEQKIRPWIQAIKNLIKRSEELSLSTLLEAEFPSTKKIPSSS